MIGVGPEARAPALGERPPHGVIHDLLRGPASAAHLTDRLLRGERHQVTARLSYGAQMPGGCQTQPITEPDCRPQSLDRWQ